MVVTRCSSRLGNRSRLASRGKPALKYQIILDLPSSPQPTMSSVLFTLCLPLSALAPATPSSPSLKRTTPPPTATSPALAFAPHPPPPPNPPASHLPLTPSSLPPSPNPPPPPHKPQTLTLVTASPAPPPPARPWACSSSSCRGSQPTASCRTTSCAS